jgi:IS5 family transposase
LLSCVAVVLKQIDRTLAQLNNGTYDNEPSVRWVTEVQHYRAFLLKVVDQTQQRVYEKKVVPAEHKVVSIFESHTDIIVKGARDLQYGHKVNLVTDRQGMITYFDILEGNPADKALYLPVLNSHQALFAELPHTTIADGGYASLANASTARAAGVIRSAFHKRAELGFHAMGVKRKTLKALRSFRAGIEGNISELKRAFCMSRARWKKHDGFKAFVWSSVLAYNLVRLSRISSA